MAAVAGGAVKMNAKTPAGPQGPTGVINRQGAVVSWRTPSPFFSLTGTVVAFRDQVKRRYSAAGEASARQRSLDHSVVCLNIRGARTLGQLLSRPSGEGIRPAWRPTGSEPQSELIHSFSSGTGGLECLDGMLDGIERTLLGDRPVL